MRSAGIRSTRRSTLCTAVLVGLGVLFGAACCGERQPNADAPSPSSAPVVSVTRVAPPAPAPGESWNTAQIEWFDYTSGVAYAKAHHLPVCLVFYATWCPHCKNYSRVFENPKIVTMAKEFVMIRVNSDEESDVAKAYAKDGAYVPRTYFLKPDGSADYEIHSANPRFAYFYHERNPESLLAGMTAARQKLSQ